MDKQFTEKTEKVEKGLTDISLVAYLVSIGIKMERISKGKDKSTFYFDQTDRLEHEILKYFNNNANVNPLKFSETLRNLRSYAKQ